MGKYVGMGSRQTLNFDSHCGTTSTLFILCVLFFFLQLQLDGLLKGLGFTQKKADSQVRWAVLNTVLALRRHKKARSQLAEAMSSGKSVGSCIGVIEENINSEDI